MLFVVGSKKFIYLGHVGRPCDGPIVLQVKGGGSFHRFNSFKPNSMNLFKCVRLISLCFAFQSVDVQLAFTAFAPVAAQCH